MLNQSVNCIELDEFNYLELMYYKIGQSLLQNGTGIRKWYNFFTKRGKHYYKVRQIPIFKRWDKGYYNAGQIIYYKVGNCYYRVGRF